MWQPVGGGTESVLNLPGVGIKPSVSRSLIAFTYDPTASGHYQNAVYDKAGNTLYNLTDDPAAAGLYPTGVGTL